MKRVEFRSVAMLLVFMLATSIAFSQSSFELRAKIESLNREMAKNMITGNSEKSLSLYTSDAISMPNGEPLLRGIDAIRKSSSDMQMKGVKYNSFEPKTLDVLVNGNIITEVGTYTINLSIPGSAKPIEDHGKYLTLWEKQKDGSLKIKIETWNSDVNPMEMNTAQQTTPDDPDDM